MVEYTSGLFSAFPDLSFDIVSAAPAGEAMVAAQWLMKGTNTGPVMSLPPTGQSVALAGTDFITVKGDKIESVQGYFDQKAFVEQLGLQAIVQPYFVGPVSLGTCAYLQPGNRTRPGAFSLTSFTVHSEEEAEEVVDHSRRIFGELLEMPGFISGMTARAGYRMSTIFAWEDTEALKQLLRGGAHKEVMDRFYGPDFAVGGMVSA